MSGEQFVLDLVFDRLDDLDEKVATLQMTIDTVGAVVQSMQGPVKDNNE